MVKFISVSENEFKTSISAMLSGIRLRLIVTFTTVLLLFSEMFMAIVANTQKHELYKCYSS